MKNIYLAIIALLTLSVAQAQFLEMSQDTFLFEEVVDAENQKFDLLTLEYTITNVSDNLEHVGYEVVEYNLPANMNGQMCVPGVCLILGDEDGNLLENQSGPKRFSFGAGGDTAIANGMEPQESYSNKAYFGLSDPNASLWFTDTAEFHILFWFESDSIPSRTVAIFRGHITADSSMVSSIKTVKADQNANVIVYPNPVVDELNIKTVDGELISKVEVYSVLGRKVIESNGFNKTLFVGDLDHGLYLVKSYNTAGELMAINKIELQN